MFVSRQGLYKTIESTCPNIEAEPSRWLFLFLLRLTFNRTAVSLCNRKLHLKIDSLVVSRSLHCKFISHAIKLFLIFC